MVKHKLKHSLAKENYVKTLIIKGVCEVKQLVDYENHKMKPQLVNDLMTFIELEISNGKFSKEDFDKSKILQDVIISIFGDLSESELKWLEHIIDNKLVKKNTLLKKAFKLLKLYIVSSKSQKK